jgi:two-component system phosphate regulon sensor histidine kinase PhoR
MMVRNTDAMRAGLSTARARLRAASAVIAAAVVLLGLAASGALALMPALVGLLLVVLAAWWGRRQTLPAAALPVVASEQETRTRLLETVLAGLPDPVVALDGSGIVLALNAPAGALAPALRPGEPASLVLRTPALVDAVRRAVATGEPQRVEFSLRVPIDRSYRAHVIPARPAQGPPLPGGLLLLTLHDLTPLRRSEEMRADFIANASHELRTPLASLAGFIDTLLGPARDDAAARERFLAIMREQAQRMARLIDDLLSLSRIELHLHIPPETPIDVASLVREVVDSLQSLAQARAVEVVLDAAPDPLVVRGDRDELIRVFENLLENALKYAGGGKRVDIRLSAAPAQGGEPEAAVSVRDYGPGIAPEHLPRLTERFYRVDASHSRAEGGTGLGLALVKHVLQRHGGRLRIDSTLGAGTTFTVSLPLAGGPPAGKTSS